jgi:hypothetical protein
MRNTVNLGDLSFLAANFMKSRANGRPLLYVNGFPEHWPSNPLRAVAAPPTRSTSSLTDEQLAPIVDDAIARIESRQDHPELVNVTVAIVDLPGTVLGRAIGENLVQIDVNAAGRGWFVDDTPWDDREFAVGPSSHDLMALPGTLAETRVDLLTVILHELGHVVGYEHDDNGVMAATLPPGVRRVWDDSFGALSDAELPQWISDDNRDLPAAFDEFFATQPL